MSNSVTKAVEQIYTMNNDQLNQVVEAIKLRRTYLTREAARSFSVGQMVSFTNRSGGKVTGSIQKVNRKYIIVDAHVGGSRYKVPASMLETI